MNRQRATKDITKRVCIIRHSSYPEVPPTRRNAEALVASGYVVDVICSRKKGQPKEELINGVMVYRLPLEHQRQGAVRYVYEYMAFFMLAFFKLTAKSIRNKYLAVEVEAMPDFLVFATIFAKLRGTKVTLNMLDFMPQTFANQFKISRKHILVKALNLVELVCMRFADHVVLPHIPLRERYSKKGIACSKTTAILNVPDENIFQRRNGSSNQAVRKDFKLITHGSLLEKYGVQILIQAVPLLISEIPGLKVEIVGDGEYRARLEDLARELGVEKYIQFIGFVPMEVIPDYISHADVGVICLLLSMMPTKLFEYFSMNKPVIASDFPAMRAYFDEDSIEYYQPGDALGLAWAIIDLYRNPPKRESLANSSSSFYQTVRWNIAKERYIDIFDRYAGEKTKYSQEKNLPVPNDI